MCKCDGQQCTIYLQQFLQHNTVSLGAVLIGKDRNVTVETQRWKQKKKIGVFGVAGAICAVEALGALTSVGVVGQSDTKGVVGPFVELCVVGAICAACTGGTLGALENYGAQVTVGVLHPSSM